MKNCMKCIFGEEKPTGEKVCKNKQVIEEHEALCGGISTGFLSIILPHAYAQHCVGKLFEPNISDDIRLMKATISLAIIECDIQKEQTTDVYSAVEMNETQQAYFNGCLSGISNVRLRLTDLYKSISGYDINKEVD